MAKIPSTKKGLNHILTTHKIKGLKVVKARKPSAYNEFVGKKIKEGMSFKSAVAQWKPSK